MFSNKPDYDQTIPLLILQRIKQGPKTKVWTPSDFYDLGAREAIKKNLQRLVDKNKIRRIDRGLYDQLYINPLTKQSSPPDYRMVIEAISRRDQIRTLIDGLTAANDLGLTNAVPAKVIVHTDARLRTIKLDKLVIQFKLTAPSKLYWVGHPAMRLVQSLYWFRDSLKKGTLVDEKIVNQKIIKLMRDQTQGDVIRKDLIQGLHAMPSWMRDWVHKLLQQENMKMDGSKYE